MKRPLFPDGFLINAHHSHPSARQEEPPPSFLSPNALQPAPLPIAWGQVEGPSGWEDATNKPVWAESGSSSLLLPGLVGSPPPVGGQPSALPCSGARPVPWGSWNGSPPQPVPVLSPKLCAHLLLPRAGAVSKK